MQIFFSISKIISQLACPAPRQFAGLPLPPVEQEAVPDRLKVQHHREIFPSSGSVSIARQPQSRSLHQRHEADYCDWQTQKGALEFMVILWCRINPIIFLLFSCGCGHCLLRRLLCLLSGQLFGTHLRYFWVGFLFQEERMDVDKVKIFSPKSVTSSVFISFLQKIHSIWK